MSRLKCLRSRLAPAPASTGTWQHDSVRGSRHQRGYGWEWEKTRKGIRERANDLCEPHLAIGVVHIGCHCDHKTPKAMGGTDAETNLHWVCEPFHKAKTQRESRGEVVDIEAIALETRGAG
jgi:5-methylcytosine-specific restriction protein A